MVFSLIAGWSGTSEIVQADKTKGSPCGKPFYNLYKYIRSSPKGKCMMMIMYEIDQHGPQN